MADRIFVILKPGKLYPRRRRVRPQYGINGEDPVPTLTNLVKEVNAAELSRLFAGPPGQTGVDPRRVHGFELDEAKATRQALGLIADWHTQHRALEGFLESC